MASGMYSNMMREMRTAFSSGKSRDYNFRKRQLEALLRMLDENKSRFYEALLKDLGRCLYEADVCDILTTRNECVTTLNNLQSWMQPEKVDGGLENLGNQTLRYAEPLGVVLVIGTWNYPVNLTLGPLIGAMAAGNSVIIKPSEVSVKTSEVLAELVPKYLDSNFYRVVTGAVPEVTALLEERFDRIFYTGNSFVGKIIMAAAAKHLTPVTLELGGKSPVYVGTENDFQVVANRILTGKLVNNGQTCIAPDYLLVQEQAKAPLLEELHRAYKKMYGGSSLDSENCANIINQNHFHRLRSLMDQGRVLLGGRLDQEKHNIEFTVFEDVPEDAPLWKQEIFGPLLLLRTVKSPTEAIEFINAREKPLALYVFSRDSQLQQRFIAEVPSGGVTVNDTLLHFAVPTLPFGGVGNSGMGAYHHKESFETFSHRKSVLITKQNKEFVFNAIRYPPYTNTKLQRINMIMSKKLRSGGIAGYWPVVLLLGALAVVLKIMGLDKFVRS